VHSPSCLPCQEKLNERKLSACDGAVLKVCDYLDVLAGKGHANAWRRLLCFNHHHRLGVMDPSSNTTQASGGQLNAFAGAQGVQVNDLNFTQAQNVHYHSTRPLGEHASCLIGYRMADP
jgi:hypothetical protein